MIVRALVRLGLDDAARPEDVVGDEQALVGEQRQRGLVVVEVALLVRVDEHEVEGAVEAADRLERGAEPVVDVKVPSSSTRRAPVSRTSSSRNRPSTGPTII